MAICRVLGVPLAEEKLEGPLHCLMFLSIKMDTLTGRLRLLADKVFQIRDKLAEWSAWQSCQRQQFETLQHACQDVKPGRTLFRRMVDLLCIPGAIKGHHHIRLNCEFCADLQWWVTQNGVTMFSCIMEPSICDL